MTTEILNKKKENEIDWSIPQWVIDDSLEFIILTNGNSNENCFSGISLPNNMYKQGENSNSWSKSHFQPIPKEGLQILIKN